MTVEELIKELKKYPMNAKVGWQDHDASEDKISAIVCNVFPFDPEMSNDPKYCMGIGVIITT